MWKSTVYVGAIINPLAPKKLDFIEEGVMLVDDDGTIRWLVEARAMDLKEVLWSFGVDVEEDYVRIVWLDSEEFLVPGLIDTHTHPHHLPTLALTYNANSRAMSDFYNAKVERDFSDGGYASARFSDVVDVTLAYGTTTACYTGTIYSSANELLVATCERRAFVGQCVEDGDLFASRVPPTEMVLKDLSDFRRSFDHPHNVRPGAVTRPPLVNPFVALQTPATCTPALLESLQQIVRPDDHGYRLPVHGHLAQSAKHLARARELHTTCPTSASVYAKYDLLRPGDIIAYTPFMSPEDRCVIAASEAGISVCPNLAIEDEPPKMEAIQVMLNEGIAVGLGTSCSGGLSPSVLSVARQVARGPRYDPDPLSRQHDRAFYLATLGGAKLCRIDDRVGSFEPGKEFDALRIKPTSPTMRFGLEERSLKRRLERWFWGGDDRDIFEVYVRGVRVAGTAPYVGVKPAKDPLL